MATLLQGFSPDIARSRRDAIATAASPPFVLHAAADAAVAANALDPYERASGDAAAFIVPTCGLPFLSLELQLARASSAPAISTALQGIVYGFREWRRESSGKSPTPNNADAAFDDLSGATYKTKLSVPGIWTPLFKPNATSPVLDFGTDIRLLKDDTTGSAKQLATVLANNFVFVQGVSHVLFVPTQAAVGTFDGAIVVGAFNT